MRRCWLRSRALVLVFTVLGPSGCMGTLRSAEGTDLIRGAVWFAGREAELNGTATSDTPDTPLQTLTLLSNSTLPCEPEQVTDDPETGIDEAAAAQEYWQAQVLSAFTREGAVLVLLGAYTWSDALTGDYTVSPEALQDHLALLATTPRVGFGAWMRVNEAAVDESTGMFFSYTDTDIDFDAGAAEGSTLSLAVQGNLDNELGGETLTGDFDLQPSGMKGHFRADRCRNDALYTAIVAQEVALQYLVN